MIEFLTTILIGYAGHQGETITRHWFPDDDTNRLISYTEGGILVLFAFAILALSTLPRREALIAIAVLAASFVGVGSGTVLGYVFDGVARKAAQR